MNGQAVWLGQRFVAASARAWAAEPGTTRGAGILLDGEVADHVFTEAHRLKNRNVLSVAVVA